MLFYVISQYLCIWKHILHGSFYCNAHAIFTLATINWPIAAVCCYVAKSSVCNSCNIGTSDLPDMYAQSPRAYISGKSRVPMLQPICNIALWRAEVSSSQKSQN